MEKQIKIHDVIQETSDAITVVFAKDEHFNSYSSGQFVNIFQKYGDDSISRSYSFSSSPLVDDHPSITIKRVPGGILSNFLVDNLKKNQEIKVSRPLGRFGLGDIPEEGHLVFIAGGSGITPLFSMIKTALHSTFRLKITLLYGNRNKSSIIFLDQLNALKRNSNGRLKVYHFLDAHSDKDGFNAINGPISLQFLESLLQKYQRSDGFFICGPDGMMKSVRSHLEALGVVPGNINFESFGISLKKDSAIVGKSSKITFIQPEGKIQLNIPADKFILETALTSGVPLPHSCKEAMCGSCMVKIIEGNVKMQENYALTDAQISAGYTLLCSALPITDEITLSYLEL